MSKQKYADQEVTALNNFGYIENGRNGKEVVFGEYNGIAMANRIEKDLTIVKEITSAQLLALFTTPIEIIPAPGAGYYNKPKRMVINHGTGTAYSGIAAGEDLVLKWTDASGAECSPQIETTGFLDQTTAQIREVGELVTVLTPVANAAVVLHLLVGNITTGNYPIRVFVEYDIIPTDFAG
jgi:hypothetical protein